MDDEFDFGDAAAGEDLLAAVARGAGDDPSLEAVARLFEAATADLEPAPLPEPAFLAQLVDAVRAGAPAPLDELATRRRRRIARSVLVAGAIGLTATGAAAANGSLPGAVQNALRDVAGLVGVDLPAGSQDGPGHGRSDEAPGRPEDPGQPAQPGRSDEAPGRPETPGSQGGGVGSEGTPPGQGGTIPGTGEEPPRPPVDPGPPGTIPTPSDDVPPGQGGTVPGTGEEPGRPEDPGGRGGPPDGTGPGATASGRGQSGG